MDGTSKKQAPKRSTRAGLGRGVSPTVMIQVDAAGTVPVKRPRGRQPEPNGREKLLKAAASAFMERGYSGTSMDDIANLMGATKGYVYHHYTSKSALYFGVHDWAMQRIDGLVRPVYESQLPCTEKLQRMAYEHVLTVLTDFPSAKVAVQGLERGLMKGEGVQVHRDLRRVIRMRDEYEKMFTSLIARGIEDGSFRDEKVSLLAKGVLGALNWTTLWFDPSRTTTLAQMKEMAERLAFFVVQGIRRP